MKCAVFSFLPQLGPGTQALDNVVQDRDGANFVGKVWIFQGAFAVINTVTAGAVFIGGYSDFRGVDTGAVRSASTGTDAYSPFNFKAVDAGLSLGDHSIMDVWSDNFGQAQIYRTAKIANIRSGGFDIIYDSSARNGDTVFVTVLGGDDADFAFPSGVINGTYTTPSKPQGILAISTPKPQASGTTTWGTGGSNVQWGYATRDGDYGNSNIYVVNQGNNYTVQLGTQYSSGIDGSGVLSGEAATISAWNDLSYTIANSIGTSSWVMAVCGDLILTSGRTGLQPTSNGTQVVDLGLAADAIFMMWTGREASGATSGPSAMMANGWTNGTTQQGFWTGEATNGNTPPLLGARYLSSDTILRAGTPNGLSTTFDAVASITNIDRVAGTATITWSATDATQREWKLFAIGPAVEPPPPTLGLLLTQLPVSPAYPYQAVSPQVVADGLHWVTPPPTRSRRGR